MWFIKEYFTELKKLPLDHKVAWLIFIIHVIILGLIFELTGHKKGQR